MGHMKPDKSRYSVIAKVGVGAAWLSARLMALAIAYFLSHSALSQTISLDPEKEQEEELWKKKAPVIQGEDQAFEKFFDNSSDVRNIHDHLPHIGDEASAAVSLDEEYRFGQKWVQELRSQVDIVEDPVLQHYVETLVNRLAEANEQLQERRLTVVILNNSSLNAFAAPGGIIGVNTGLFHYARNEAEFASVMAHEVAHLSQRHYARQSNRSRTSSKAQLALLLASLLLITQDADADVAQAALISSAAGLYQSQLAYSRQYEREADRVGYLTMEKVGYLPHAYSRLFARLVQSAGTGLRLEYLSTHPLPENRVSDAAVRSIGSERTGKEDSTLYQIMRVRAASLTDGNSSATTNWDQFLSRVECCDETTIAKYYEAALGLQRFGSYAQALEVLAKIPQPSNREQAVVLNLLRADLHLLNQQPTQAVEVLEPYYVESPFHYPLAITYSRAQLASNQAHLIADADQALRTLKTFNSENPLIWRHLSLAQIENNQAYGYHRFLARYFEMMGNYRVATQQVKLALEQVELVEDEDESSQLTEVLSAELERLKKKDKGDDAARAPFTANSAN